MFQADLLSMEGEGSGLAVLGSLPLGMGVGGKVEGIVLSPKEIAHLERNKAPETPARLIKALWATVNTSPALHPEVVSLVEKHAMSLLAGKRTLFEREYCELATRLYKTRTACGKSLSEFVPSDGYVTSLNDLLRPLRMALYYMKEYEESPAAAKAREDKKRRGMVAPWEAVHARAVEEIRERRDEQIRKGISGRGKQMLDARYNEEIRAAAAAQKAAIAAQEAAIAAQKAALALERERLRRDALVTKHGLTPSEAEAVLAHFGAAKYSPKISFPKDTLTALRVINGFAAKNGIRFEDAETVLRE